MTRGRAMFGVGPGALVHDAMKIGIKAEDQRRMMNELLDVIVRLLRGETVTEKTDWYDLRTRSCNCPATRSRSWRWRWRHRARRPARWRPGGTASACCRSAAPVRTRWLSTRQNWGLYEEQARLNGHVPDRGKWRLVTLFHIAETREQARENVKLGIDAFRDYFTRCRDVPDRAARYRGPYKFFMESGAACIGTPDDAIAYIERAAEGIRRLRRDHGAGAQLGGLGRDEAALRIDGALRPSAFPAVARTAARQYAYARDHHDEFAGQSAAAVQAEIDALGARRAAE